MRINRVKNLIPAPKDGQRLYLVVTPLQLGLDKNSNWKGGVNTVTVEVWRQKGNDEPTQSDMGAYSVIVYKNGSSAIKVTKLNTASFTFEASKSDTSYEIVLKVNSKKADSKTVTISADGITGVGVSSVTEYYLASSSGSGVTTSTSGWTTDPTAAAATLTATKKFLWNYEKVTYTDGTSVNTTPAIIGRYGDKGDKGDQGNTGVSITSVTEYYLASANYTNVTRSTSGWTTDPTANAAKLTASKKYLWNYEVIGYSDGSTDETDPVIIGVYGDKGDKGDQGNTGNGISSITEYYLASASGSGVTSSTSGWTTDPTAAAATLTATKKYLWNYEKVTYTNGSEVSTTPVIIGRYGDKGDKGDKGNTGVSITSITEYYLASSAYTGVTRNTSGWTTDPTSSAATITASKKYLWNYEVIGYSDGSSDETDPVIIGVYGDKGDKGDQGDQGNTGTGISSTTWYYLATTMATGVTRSTSGWTTSYQQGTPDLPYVWRYGDTLLTNGSHQYTACELIFSYSAGANPNLLEQTNFSSLLALDKWTGRNSCVPVSGVTVTQESYAGIETGIQAHNAYFDRTYKTTSQIQYKEILQQVLWNTTGTIRKLEPSTWYTFSFWTKGDYNIATFIYPSVFDNTSICYIDGVMQEVNTLGSDAYINWTLSSTWKRHTFTFKTKSSISGADQYLLFRLYPKTSSYTSNRVYICMPKLEVGMQATSYISNEESTHFGQVRNRRWAINTQYQAGKVDEQYDDTVLLGETGFFHCIKSHISTLDNAPNGTYGSIYWEATSKVAFLATDIFFAEKALINNLIATLIQTGYSGSPHIEAEGSEFKIFGRGQYPAIYLAVNSDNKAVLRFQNENTGEFLYDLGPDGIMKEFSEVADSYTQMKLKKLTNVTRVSEILDISESDCTTYYRFNEGYKQLGSGNNITKQYHVSGGSSPSSKNSQYFTTQNYNGTTIANGWYVKPNRGNYMQKITDQLEQLDNGLYDNVKIYQVTIYEFSGGKLVSSVPVYFLYTDYQYASHSVGCDKNGNELSTYTYTYLYSYYQSITL